MCMSAYMCIYVHLCAYVCVCLAYVCVQHLYISGLCVEARGVGKRGLLCEAVDITKNERGEIMEKTRVVNARTRTQSHTSQLLSGGVRYV